MAEQTSDQNMSVSEKPSTTNQEDTAMDDQALPGNNDSIDRGNQDRGGAKCVNYTGDSYESDSSTETDDEELTNALDRVLRSSEDTSDSVLKSLRHTAKDLRRSLKKFFKRKKREGQEYSSIISDIETYGFEPDLSRHQSKSERKNVVENTVPATENATPPSATKHIEREGSGQKQMTSHSNVSREPSTQNIQRPPSHSSTSQTHRPRTRRRLPSVPVVDPDVYNFSHSQRGYMVIIVNETFMRQNPRDGAIFDLTKAKSIAITLGFRIFNPLRNYNLSKSKTMEILREAQRMDHSKFDCFAFLISSHGVEACNPRLRGKKDHALICSDDQMFFTSTLLEMFKEKNCPTLKGKPKLFFIQACRGMAVDDGGNLYVRNGRTAADRASPMWLNTSEGEADARPEISKGDYKSSHRPRNTDVSDVRHSEDSWAKPSTPIYKDTAHPQLEEGAFRFIDESQLSPRIPESFEQRRSHFTFQHDPPRHQYTPKPYPIVDAPVIQCDADFVVMYAIPPGMFAWRNTTEGSWMIDYLDQVIKQYDLNKPRNFLHLLTRVSSLMSQRETNAPSDPKIHKKKAITVVENTLTKDILFQRKVDFRHISHETIDYLTVV